MRICLITSKATSLSNVAKDIAKVAMGLGHPARLFSYLIPPVDMFKCCDAAIYVMTFSPVWIGTWLMNYRDVTIGRLKGRKWIPAIMYVTIEGRPKIHLMQDWMGRHVRYYAVSKYVRARLMEAGLPIEGVVYHGVDPEVVEEAKNLVPIVRKKLLDSLGVKHLYVSILSQHPRKGLKQLLRVWENITSELPDTALYVLTPAREPTPPQCYIDNKFGQYTKPEVFALMGAADYVIVPSYCEGFGLPLIEANAMGTPVIHCLYPPLTEITGEHNITFPYSDIRWFDAQEGIQYEFHVYEDKELADAIKQSYDILVNKPDAYKELSSKAVEHAKKFDIFKLYPKLIQALKP